MQGSYETLAEAVKPITEETYKGNEKDESGNVITVEQALAKGRPYVPSYANMVENGISKLDFPHTIFAHVMLHDLLVASESLPKVFLGQGVMILAVAFFTQFFFCFHLHEIVTTSSREACSDGSGLLRMLCVGVFFVVMLKCFGETFSLTRYVQELPEWKESMLGITEKSPWQVSLLYKKIPSRNGTVLLTIPATGITCKRRIWCYLMITLKAAIESYLVYVGTIYVASSDSNEALILNSVAVTFVEQIDDLMYYTFVPEWSRNMHHPPSITLDPPDESSSDLSAKDICDLCSTMIYFFFGIPIFIGSVALVMNTVC